ncbi:hypothetical protein H6F61_22885 [Cyanobacteria bacterium FACHB-472]|nr:hypothetical protein [Cyanobacteria bacterium FACHB-472]
MHWQYRNRQLAERCTERTSIKISHSNRLLNKPYIAKAVIAVRAIAFWQDEEMRSQLRDGVFPCCFPPPEPVRQSQKSLRQSQSGRRLSLCVQALYIVHGESP